MTPRQRSGDRRISDKSLAERSIRFRLGAGVKPSLQPDVDSGAGRSDERCGDSDSTGHDCNLQLGIKVAKPAHTNSSRRFSSPGIIAREDPRWPTSAKDGSQGGPPRGCDGGAPAGYGGLRGCATAVSMRLSGGAGVWPMAFGAPAPWPERESRMALLARRDGLPTPVRCRSYPRVALVTESLVVDAADRRRSPATMPGFHAGRPPRNKGLRYPADPPTVEEIVAVMRIAGDGLQGARDRREAYGVVSSRARSS